MLFTCAASEAGKKADSPQRSVCGGRCNVSTLAARLSGVDSGRRARSREIRGCEIARLRWTRVRGRGWLMCFCVRARVQILRARLRKHMPAASRRLVSTQVKSWTLVDQPCPRVTRRRPEFHFLLPDVAVEAEQSRTDLPAVTASSDIHFTTARHTSSRPRANNMEVTTSRHFKVYNCPTCCPGSGNPTGPSCPATQRRGLHCGLHLACRESEMRVISTLSLEPCSFTFS